MKRWMKAVGIAMVGGAAGGGALWAIEPYVPASPAVIGVKVGGETLARGTDPAGHLADKDRELLKKTITLVHEGQTFELDMADLGVAIDIDATAADVRAIGHSGSWLHRLRQTRDAREGKVDIPLRYRLDEDRARRALEKVASTISTKAKSASLDLKKKVKVADVPGITLDVEGTLATVMASVGKTSTTDIVTHRVDADVTLKDLEDIHIDRVLATFETKYNKYKKGRSANVVRATNLLDGLVIPPMKTVSFNDRVGPRSLDRGFKHAPEIVGDELSIGVGGGTCQVSTTFYGAALYGALDVVKRRSHSRPSSYTKLGLDATVSYGNVDLQLRNPFSFTIVVHAFIPKDGIVKVELLGGEMVAGVDYSYGVSRVESYMRRITVKSFLKDGRSFRKQKGTRGMDVHSNLIIRLKDGRVIKKRYYSGYRATPEVFWVAPDYDHAELPELPKHAKGVEGAATELEVYGG